MKAILINLFILIGLSGCVDNTQVTTASKTGKDPVVVQIDNLPLGVFVTIEIEGCQYLISKNEIDANEAMGFMAHKGNCNNTIHCRSID